MEVSWKTVCRPSASKLLAERNQEERIRALEDEQLIYKAEKN
jgi:hypothetical protein